MRRETRSRVHLDLVLDDGAADLAGAKVPDVELQFVEEAELSLGAVARRVPLVVCLFGGIDEASQLGGAEARRLDDWIAYEPHVARHGFRMVAISSEPLDLQMRWLDLIPSWLALSDPELLLARSLRLATCMHQGRWAYRPANLVTISGRVVGSFAARGRDDPRCVLGLLNAVPGSAGNRAWRTRGGSLMR